MRKTFQRTALTGAVAVVSLAGMLTPAGAVAPAWRILHTNTAKTVGTDENELNGITAINAKDVWSVGRVGRNDGHYNHSLAQHWNGTKWTDTTLPVQFRKSTTISSYLQVVASSSSKNVWAFGSSGPVNGASRSQYALRWDGTRWTVAHSWKISTWSSIYKAVVLSPTNVWAFSQAGDTFGAWHYDGKTWAKVKTPGFQLIAASAVSASNIWAVVSAPTTNTLGGRFVAHYDGHTWKLVPTPDIPQADPSAGDTPEYNAIRAQSSNDVWVVGGRQVSTNDVGLIAIAAIALHWNGTTWQRLDGPTPAAGHSDAPLDSVTPDGKGGIWTTASPGYSGRSFHVTLIGGKWTAATLPKVNGKALFPGELAQVPGTTTIWGAGLLSWGGQPNTNGAVLKYS